jgi:hypothetical protein
MLAKMIYCPMFTGNDPTGVDPKWGIRSCSQNFPESLTDVTEENSVVVQVGGSDFSD